MIAMLFSSHALEYYPKCSIHSNIRVAMNSIENPDVFLTAAVDKVRSHTGTTGKKAISAAAKFVAPGDPIRGPGDDGAIVEIGAEQVVACGEAISPPFVSSDPYGAGIAAVLANVNDVAAMGGEPRGIVNTIIGPDALTSEVMRGIQDAASMYDVPVIGGHLTQRDGECALSAFAVGSADRVLSMANVRPGQVLLMACSLAGHMRPDFPFFTSLEKQGPTLARDIRLLARVASRGLAVAAKDVSMAGPLGSLAMLLEYTRCGATVDMRRHPMPADSDPLSWLVSFPTYAFWLTAEPETVAGCVEVFENHGLICAQVGEVTGDSKIVLTHGQHSRTLFDLSAESITGLWG